MARVVALAATRDGRAAGRPTPVPRRTASAVVVIGTNAPDGALAAAGGQVPSHWRLERLAPQAVAPPPDLGPEIDSVARAYREADFLLCLAQTEASLEGDKLLRLGQHRGGRSGRDAGRRVRAGLERRAGRARHAPAAVGARAGGFGRCCGRRRPASSASRMRNAPQRTSAAPSRWRCGQSRRGHACWSTASRAVRRRRAGCTCCAANIIWSPTSSGTAGASSRRWLTRTPPCAWCWSPRRPTRRDSSWRRRWPRGRIRPRPRIPRAIASAFGVGQLVLVWARQWQVHAAAYHDGRRRADARRVRRTAGHAARGRCGASRLAQCATGRAHAALAAGRDARAPVLDRRRRRSRWAPRRWRSSYNDTGECGVAWRCCVSAGGGGGDAAPVAAHRPGPDFAYVLGR